MVPGRSQLKAQESGELCSSCSADCNEQGTCSPPLPTFLFCREAPSVFSATQATGGGDPHHVKQPLAVLPCLSFLLLWYELLFCFQVALSCRQGPLLLISTRIHSFSSHCLIFSAKCKLPTPSNNEIRARAGCPALLVSCGSGCGVSLRYIFLNSALINYHAASRACQIQLAVSPDTSFKMQCQGRDIPAPFSGWWVGECSPAPPSLAVGLVC